MMVCVPSFLSWRAPNLVIEETVDADLQAAGHREPLTLARRGQRTEAATRARSSA